MHGDYYLNRRFSDEYLNQLAAWITVMFLAVVLGFVVNHIMNSAKVPPHGAVTEDVTGLEKENATRKATEGTSSFYVGRAEKITVCCCVGTSMIVIMSGAIINLRKESLYGERERGISQDSCPSDT